MPDDLVRERQIPPPLKGFRDGLDAGLDDGLYPLSYSPDLRNIRVAKGQWETRLGTAISVSLPGSGTMHLLANYYPVAGTDAAKRIRVFARNGTLYDFVEGTDTAFQTTSGGSGLGTTERFYNSVQLGDRLYFLDRVGALRRYESAPSSGNQVRSVTQPTAPAASPDVRPRPFKVLTRWAAGEVAAWNETASGDFDIALDSTNNPSPSIYGGSASLTMTTTSARGKRITRFNSGATLESRHIGFYIKSATTKNLVNYVLGQATVSDFSTPLIPKSANDWEPIFVPTSDLPAPYYVSFFCVNSPTAGQVVWVSDIVLPGKLDGLYRWVYTHYDPTTGRESQPSPITNNGLPLNFATEGESYNSTSTQAMKKSCILIPTTDSGSDATTTKFRFYRNGGTEALTKNTKGQDVWYRVATISDVAALHSDNGGGSPATAGDVAIRMAVNPATSGFAVGDWIVIDKGNAGSEDFAKITGLTATNIQFTGHPLEYSHANGITVAVVFNDNVSNAEVDVTTPIDLARNDPPSVGKWIARTNDGRLAIGGFTGKPTGVAFSNRPTPDRPEDYEVFPDAIDPLTYRNPNQGFRAEIGGDSSDEQIMWMGNFGDALYAFTKANLYRITSTSQTSWGPNAFRREFAIGCISGETVAEVNGQLYWVAPGPRVLRWDGSGGPETVSADKVREVLAEAPTSLWTNWFARAHATRDGHYYLLWLTPSGQTTNTLRLDFNADIEAWEPCDWYNAGGTALAWGIAHVRYGGSNTTDVAELYAAATNSILYQMNTGATDSGAPIHIRLATKDLGLGASSLLKEWFTYLDAVDDSVTLTVDTVDTEYGENTQDYTISLSGSGALEIRRRLHRHLIGRQSRLTVTGSVTSRPKFRQMRLRYLPMREQQITDAT